MIEVELPDGTVAEFPDGTPTETIKSALQRRVGAPQQGQEADKGFWGNTMENLNAVRQGGYDVLTFGLADELGAGIRYLGGKIGARPEETYQQSLDAIRRENEALAAANPIATGTGQALMGLAMATRLPSVNMGSGLASRVGAGALEGGLYGGAYGAGSGEGAADRVTQALIGAGTGAAVGGAVPVVASGVSSAYRNVADRMARGQAAQAAGVRPEVARLLTNVMEADASLGPQGTARMAAAGPEAMIADAGPNARSVLDTAIQRGGPGGVLARGRIDERVARDSVSLGRALDSSLGRPQGVSATQVAIRDASRPQVNAAYRLANEMPIDYASEAGKAVEDIINRIPNRIKQSAIMRANERMIYDGMPNMQIMADIADDGAVKFLEMPNVAQADAIKKALDDIVRDGTDETGKLSADAAFASRMARDLRDAVADAVPEYGAALKTAADPLSRASAVDLGSKLLRPGMTRDKLAIAVDGYTDAQKDALAQGVRSYIDDTVANVTRTIQEGGTEAREAYKVIRDLSSRASREKLEIALGRERVGPLFDELDRVAQSFNLRGAVAENSKTFARQATSGMVDDITSPGVIATAAQGKPVGALQRVAQALTGQTPERVAERQGIIYSDIADFLTRPSSQSVPAFQALSNLGTQTTANQLRAQRIAEILSGGRALAYPLATQSVNMRQR